MKTFTKLAVCILCSLLISSCNAVSETAETASETASASVSETSETASISETAYISVSETSETSETTPASDEDYFSTIMNRDIDESKFHILPLAYKNTADVTYDSGETFKSDFDISIIPERFRAEIAAMKLPVYPFGSLSPDSPDSKYKPLLECNTTVYAHTEDFTIIKTYGDTWVRQYIDGYDRAANYQKVADYQCAILTKDNRCGYFPYFRTGYFFIDDGKFYNYYNIYTDAFFDIYDINSGEKTKEFHVNYDDSDKSVTSNIDGVTDIESLQNYMLSVSDSWYKEESEYHMPEYDYSYPDKWDDMLYNCGVKVSDSINIEKIISKSGDEFNPDLIPDKYKEKYNETTFERGSYDFLYNMTEAAQNAKDPIAKIHEVSTFAEINGHFVFMLAPISFSHSFPEWCFIGEDGFAITRYGEYGGNALLYVKDGICYGFQWGSNAAYGMYFELSAYNLEEDSEIGRAKGNFDSSQQMPGFSYVFYSTFEDIETADDMISYMKKVSDTWYYWDYDR